MAGASAAGRGPPAGRAAQEPPGPRPHASAPTGPPRSVLPPARGPWMRAWGGAPSRAPDPTRPPRAEPTLPPASSSWLLGPPWPPPSTLCPAAEAPRPRRPADFPHRSPSFTSPTPAQARAGFASPQQTGRLHFLCLDFLSAPSAKDRL